MLKHFDSSHDSRKKIHAWMPQPSEEERFMDLQNQTLKQIKITLIEPYDNYVDDLSRLKQTLVGLVYLNFFKNISIIRKSAIWIWVHVYPKYQWVVTFFFKKKCWYPIFKLAEYIKANNVPKLEVFSASKVDTPIPKVIPTEDQNILTSPHSHYEFPPIYIAELEDAKIYGKSNLIFLKDSVICHDLYDFSCDYTSEEFHGRHLINPKKKCIHLIRTDMTPEYMPVAATFLDSCTQNYAHWLTEVLPRIAVFCSVEQYANIPIVVGNDLHSNIIESLSLVVGNERDIISLPEGRAIKVGKLYVTSVSGYVPYEPRYKKHSVSSHGLFSPMAFDLLRKQLLPFADNSHQQDMPRKIYLRRKSLGRKITNGDEIEKLLFDNGYVIVEPEKLTFRQQLALFRNADEIVGPSGAALANLIFTRSDIRLHILIGRYKGTSYWYWQNIACASGKQVIYSLGELNDSQSTIHSDFLIDSRVFGNAK